MAASTAGNLTIKGIPYQWHVNVSGLDERGKSVHYAYVGIKCSSHDDLVKIHAILKDFKWISEMCVFQRGEEDLAIHEPGCRSFVLRSKTTRDGLSTYTFNELDIIKVLQNTFVDPKTGNLVTPSNDLMQWLKG